VIFACLLLSYSFIKRELSYDQFNENADRIVRFSIQYNNEPVDGRNYGFSKDSPIINDIPGIEDAVFLNKVNTGLLTYSGKRQVVNDFYFASANFFEVFSYKLLEGDAGSIINAPEKVAISKTFAKQLFGEESPIGKEIQLEGRKFQLPDKKIYVNGVFDDFPETSHFHTDMILHRPDSEKNDWAYVYLLLNQNTDVKGVTDAIAGKLNELNEGKEWSASPYMMPLSDIHLHSRVLRELEVNGNIAYVYLVAGANILLLLIVLFNLWLNAGLIFSFNRRYYQLLRLNGASSSVVMADEGLFALIIGFISILFGGLICMIAFSQLNLSSIITAGEVFIICLLFMVIVILVSVFPVITKLSSTLFLNTQDNIRTSNFDLSKVKYMLIAQYCLVMFIVILSFGISKQINMIKTSQVGGKENTILVMNEQPDEVKQRFDVLKRELLKYPEIKAVTSAMQLPGSAIRDGISVRLEGESEEEARRLPLLVVGDDFLPFFHVDLIAGTAFQHTKRSFQEEENMFIESLQGKPASDLTEEYVINRKAIQALGFNSPEEAVGKWLSLDHGSLNYIRRGQIVGVTDDFNYTTTYEELIPQILMQRKIFQHCIMVNLSSDNMQKALQTFNQVWDTVNPDYPADYTFLQNIYSQVYCNELNAESLVRLFSLLCLIVANLGLIIIMAFIIKRKTKEIGIRKVNGATYIDIIKMLNNRFVIWIGVAFIIAIPAAYYVLARWLENFAHKTPMDWWIFALAGCMVLLLSVVCISWQSWQAASFNPIKALKTE